MYCSDRYMLTYITIIIVGILGCVVCYWCGARDERVVLATELCNRQQYDFCVIKHHTIYDIKENK